tara:strand:- start:1 stop:240 length:240 start_codon:yes stop_codon:yes gene_type:complete
MRNPDIIGLNAACAVQKAKVIKTWTKDEVMEKLASIEKNEKKNDQHVKKATLRLQTLQTQLLRMNMEKDRLHAILEELK